MPGDAYVWPGVSARFEDGVSALQQAWSGAAPAKATPAKPRFSFDWSQRDKKEPSTPFLSAWGSYGEGSRQRWRHFTALLVLSGCMFMLAVAFLPLVLLRPQKFCLFFTLGSMLSMASFAVLRGPLEQLKHMFSLQRCAPPPALPALPAAARPGAPRAAPPPAPAPAPRRRAARATRARRRARRRLPFTSTYLASIALTVYAAMVLQSYVLVIIFAVLQAGSLLWYLLSYIPGGAPVLKLLTRGGMRFVGALCCRGGGDGRGSYSMLPL